MAQTLKFGNGTWATKKGSTLAFNDEDGNYKPLPFTTTRATGATRVNKEGLIEVVESDRPRIDYTDTSDGVLLLEKAATNLITYSEDFSNAYWVKDGASVASGFTSPSGDTSAFKLVEGGANSRHRVGRATFASGTQRTFSVFAKKGERDYISLFDNNVVGDALKGVIFNLNTGTLSLNNFAVTYLNPTIKSLGNGWYICSVTWTPSALSVPSVGSSADGLTNSYQGDGTSGIYIYGAQLEESSYPSSYIPSQGSAVTRVADTASGSGNSEVFNDSEGVLFANIAALANDGTYRMISLSDGTVNNSTNIQYSGVSNQIRTRIENGGSPQADITSTVTSQTLFNKIAVLYKSNKFELWSNGFKVGEDTNGTPPSGINKLSFDRADGGNDFYGKTKDVRVYNTALTDLELETLTSYRSLSELVTELNLNTL